ncbi:MAG: HU family DNA-binding protein [Verrucomicrobiota bacterium]|nr:HU family DNA-binding protein [Verrucomicrobiota bacterium]
MTKSELIEHVFQQLGETETTKASIDRHLNAILIAIGEGLQKDKTVTFSGFGSFNIVHKASRQGINPATKAPITIAAANAVKFKPSKTLTERFN